MPQTFDYNPALASSALDAYSKLEQRIAPSSTPAMVDTWAGDLVQGQMGTLVRAELLAAQAGIVPWVDLGDGQKGVLNIGAAREQIDKAPPDVRAIYLANHGAVRQSVALTRAARGEQLPVEALATSYHTRPSSEGIIPLIVLAVIGVAAIAAGAWYAAETKKRQIETDGHKAIEMAKGSKAAEIAMECIRKGIPIPPEVWEAFKPSALTEEKKDVIPWGWVALGGIAVGGAAYGVHRLVKAVA